MDYYALRDEILSGPHAAACAPHAHVDAVIAEGAASGWSDSMVIDDAQAWQPGDLAGRAVLVTVKRGGKLDHRPRRIVGNTSQAFEIDAAILDNDPDSPITGMEYRITNKLTGAEAAAKDRAIADVLNNAEGAAVYGVVSSIELKEWAADTGMRAVIEDESVDKASPLRSSALTLLDLMQSGSEGLHLERPKVMAMLDCWVAAGKAAPEQKAALLACSTRQASYAEITFGAPVSAADVSRALRGPWE